MQLLIKAKLLDLKGYFERTHSLRKLLSELRDIEGGGVPQKPQGRFEEPRESRG